MNKQSTLCKKSALRHLSGGAALVAAVVITATVPEVQAQGQWQSTFTVVQQGEWHGPRLPDGQPDVQGYWSNTIGNQDNFTDPRGGIPGAPYMRVAVAPGQSLWIPAALRDPNAHPAV